MKKAYKFVLPLVALFALAGCNTDPDPISLVGNSSETPSNEVSSEEASQVSSTVSSEEAPTSNVLRGHGAPGQDIGVANSLYVDEDTNLIYEKGVKVSTPTASAKRAQDVNSGQWISTKCTADENFGEGSALGNVIRSSLFATNVTLKLSMDIEATVMPQPIHVISYLAYNCGNVIQKEVTSTTDDSFENAVTIGQSTYDVSTDTYTKLYLDENKDGVFEDRTELIAEDDPRSYTFLYRCVGNYFNEMISTDIVKTFVNEFDNFTLSEGIYSLTKNVSTTSKLTTQLHSTDTYVTLSDFSFKVNTSGDALEYYQFGIEFGTNDQTMVFSEVIKAELLNLRTTNF